MEFFKQKPHKKRARLFILLIVQVTGIEPTSRAWRAHILTIVLYLQFTNVNIRDSNLYLLSSRRRASKLHHISFSPRWFATHHCTCSTAVVTLRMAYQKSLFAHLYLITIKFLQVSCTLVSCKLQRFFLVAETGVEPAIFCLWDKHDLFLRFIPPQYYKNQFPFVLTILFNSRDMEVAALRGIL